jgi:hypothetical protein
LPNQICDNSTACISVDRLIFLVGDQVTFGHHQALRARRAPFDTAGTPVEIENRPAAAESPIRGPVSDPAGSWAAPAASASSGLGSDVKAEVRLSVQGAGATATITRTGGAAGSDADADQQLVVTTIYMETEPFRSARRTAQGRARLRLRSGQPAAQRRQSAFDFSPKVGVLRPITDAPHRLRTTRQDGV